MKIGIYYPTSDMQVDVLDDDLRPMNRWTKEDVRAFAGALEGDEVKVVLHRWEPTGPIPEAIKSVGARRGALGGMEAFGKDKLDCLEKTEANPTELHDALAGKKMAEDRRRSMQSQKGQAWVAKRM